MSMPAYAVSHPELATSVLLKTPTRDISRVLIPDDDKRVLLVSLLPFMNINEAMILQQVFFWQTVKNPQDPHHEYNYIYNTYEQWHQQFPYLGISTVRKYIQTLCDKGFLVKARMGDKSNTMMVKVNLSMLLRYIPADQLIPTLQTNVVSQENVKKEALSVFPNSAPVDLRHTPAKAMRVKRTIQLHHTPSDVAVQDEVDQEVTPARFEQVPESPSIQDVPLPATSEQAPARFEHVPARFEHVLINTSSLKNYKISTENSRDKDKDQDIKECLNTSSNPEISIEGEGELRKDRAWEKQGKNERFYAINGISDENSQSFAHSIRLLPENESYDKKSSEKLQNGRNEKLYNSDDDAVRNESVPSSESAHTHFFDPFSNDAVLNRLLETWNDDEWTEEMIPELPADEAGLPVSADEIPFALDDEDLAALDRAAENEAKREALKMSSTAHASEPTTDHFVSEPIQQPSTWMSDPSWLDDEDLAALDTYAVAHAEEIALAKATLDGLDTAVCQNGEEDTLDDEDDNIQDEESTDEKSEEMPLSVAAFDSSEDADPNLTDEVGEPDGAWMWPDDDEFAANPYAAAAQTSEVAPMDEVESESATRKKANSTLRFHAESGLQTVVQRDDLDLLFAALEALPSSDDDPDDDPHGGQAQPVPFASVAEHSTVASLETPVATAAPAVVSNVIDIRTKKQVEEAVLVEWLRQQSAVQPERRFDQVRRVLGNERKKAALAHQTQQLSLFDPPVSSFFVDHIIAQIRAAKGHTGSRFVQSFRDAKKGSVPNKKPDQTSPTAQTASGSNDQFATQHSPASASPRSKQATKAKASMADGYSEEFTLFWSVYPRRVEKKHAYVAYLKAIGTRDEEGREVTHEYLFACATHYAQECQTLQREKQYIKHGATFLSGQRRSFEEYFDGVREVAEAPKKSSAQQRAEQSRSVFDAAWAKINQAKNQQTGNEFHAKVEEDAAHGHDSDSTTINAEWRYSQ